MLYNLEAVNGLINLYSTFGGFKMFTLEGSLVDNYILSAKNKKTAIIKEVFLNAWASGFSIRLYNKIPAKYLKVVELLEDGEDVLAGKLFYK